MIQMPPMNGDSTTTAMTAERRGVASIAREEHAQEPLVGGAVGGLAIRIERPVRRERHPHGAGRDLVVGVLGLVGRDDERGDLPVIGHVAGEPALEGGCGREAVRAEPGREGLRVVGLDRGRIEPGDVRARQDPDFGRPLRRCHAFRSGEHAAELEPARFVVDRRLEAVRQQAEHVGVDLTELWDRRGRHEEAERSRGRHELRTTDEVLEVVDRIPGDHGLLVGDLDARVRRPGRGARLARHRPHTQHRDRDREPPHAATVARGPC